MKNKCRVKLVCLVNNGEVEHMEIEGQLIPIMGAIGILVERLADASGESSEHMLKGMLFAATELHKEREKDETLRG